MYTLVCGYARAYRYANVHNRLVDGVDVSIVLMAPVSVALIAVEHFSTQRPQPLRLLRVGAFGGEGAAPNFPGIVTDDVEGELEGSGHFVSHNPLPEKHS
jgi:hypothetical protein